MIIAEPATGLALYPPPILKKAVSGDWNHEIFIIPVGYRIFLLIPIILLNEGAAYLKTSRSLSFTFAQSVKISFLEGK